MKKTHGRYLRVYFVVGILLCATFDVVGAAPPVTQKAKQEVKKRPPVAPVCVAILKAYKAKDLKVLIRHSNRGNRAMLSKLKPGSSRYRSIFSPRKWRMRAVSAWDGKIRAVYVGKRRARCRFLPRGKKRFPVVSLDWEAGAWRFEDIHSS